MVLKKVHFTFLCSAANKKPESSSSTLHYPEGKLAERKARVSKRQPEAVAK